MDKSLIRTIGKVYKIPRGLDLSPSLESILSRLKSGAIDRQGVTNELYALVSGLTRWPPQEGRVEERITTIVDYVKRRNLVPKGILDIGAGTGEIITALRNYYQLSVNRVFAIDQKLQKFDQITALTYTKGGEIPLSTRSIDLVIILMTLHHIPPDVRISILREISRVLSPKGIVVIREHDDNQDPNFYVFLDVLHLFWYIAAGETPDPLYLMTHDETTNLFAQVGLREIFYDKYPEPNPQQIYHAVYGW